MRPPADLPSALVALADSLADRLRIDRADFWSYLYRRKAPTAEVRAALVEAFHPLVKPTDFLLTASDRRSTLHTMHTSEIEKPRTGRRSTLAAWKLLMAGLERAGVTLAEEEKATRRSRSSLRSFCFPADDVSYRPIPRAIADRWLDRYDIPLATWPRIVD